MIPHYEAAMKEVGGGNAALSHSRSSRHLLELGSGILELFLELEYRSLGILHGVSTSVSSRE